MAQQPPPSSSRQSSLLVPEPNPPTPQRQRPIRSTSLASDLGLYSPSIAASLTPPLDDPLQLTPLRAHYLKRELVTLEFVKELSYLDSPEALSVLGPPFLPKSRFRDGLPIPSNEQDNPSSDSDSSVDLPFLKFVFNHFILSFPFLVNCPKEFFSHKLQPFVYSFVSRNISTGQDDQDEQLLGTTKRKKIAGKFEKHLGLVMSAAIKLKENQGREEVVRIQDDGTSHTAVPASQQHEEDDVNFLPHHHNNKNKSTTTTKKEEELFSINVVSVRNVVIKGRIKNKTHEEFLIRTRRKGEIDVFVARRYGDFVRLAETLRKECVEEDVKGPPGKDKRSVQQPATPSPRNSIDGNDPSASSSNNNNLPSLARERNRLTLRAYLRSLLSNPTISSSSAFQTFLLESPIENLTDQEQHDIMIREEMDRIREREQESFKQEVEERVEELESYLRTFREELVRDDGGLSKVFGTIRETERIEDLPIQYKKVIEWARISLASTVYQLFVGSDNSSSVFSQLKRMHGLMPYFMLRGILKISNPVAMVRSVLDLFLARPFGSTSLIQKMFSTGLYDEVKLLKEDSEMVRTKIGDDRLCEKVRVFVQDFNKSQQDELRDDAQLEGLDLMTVILRSSSILPRLDARTMQKLARCAVSYDDYKLARSELSDPEEQDEGPTNDEAWLYEDLHVYRRLLTKCRDKEQLIELIFEGSTSELLKDIVTIFYEPLAKVYKAANIADSLSDLQKFLDDLIKTVESVEESSNSSSDPQSTVQIFVDLVQRHESRFYSFVHQVHSKGEGLFDNLMKWIELFINFVRDGLPKPVSLDYLLPVGGDERKAVLKEVDEIVEYHRKLKLAHHERMTKRLTKGKESDRDVDQAFVQSVMGNLRIGNVMDDVQDVEAEDESEEEEEEEYYEDSDADSQHDRVPVTSGSGNKQNKKKKKDRVTIQPPKLSHIPLLVPIFVELVREELNDARRRQKPRLGPQ